MGKKKDEGYRLTPWGCLVVVLKDYNLDVPLDMTSQMGEHLVEDFMELMEKQGYVTKTKKKEKKK